ncbi:MAG: hypothetical protein ABIT05_02915 [Chitinophagaceae bacterium]
MKKLFAVVALVGLMASCNSKKSDAKTEETKMDSAVTTTPPPTMDVPATTSNGETPKFADADVQAYADSYAAYVETYKKAAETKDMSKMAELGKMGQDLASKSVAMTQKLMSNPEESKKLADFITAKTAEIAAYSKKLSGM